MPTLREVSLALYGAWRLAWRDPAAMACFERTVPGVIRSFWAAAICYPGFVLLQLIQIDASQSDASQLFRLMLVATIAYIAGWAAYPLIALPFCRWLASEERALGFIAAYNWSQVLQTAAVLPVPVIGAFHVFAPESIAFAAIAIYVGLLVYEWFIARIALDAGALAATALVLLDVVLTALLSQVTSVMVGQPPG